MLEGLPEKSSVSKRFAVQTSASFNRVIACSSSQAVSNDCGVPSEYFMSSQGSFGEPSKAAAARRDGARWLQVG